MRVKRTVSTWAAYGTLGLLGFWLNGLGTILAPLRLDLRVDRSQVAFYPSLFAVALVLTGLTGESLIRAIGRRATMALSVVGMAAGAGLLCVPNRWVTIVGAMVLGIGCSLTSLTVMVALAEEFPTLSGRANSEANGLASVMAILVPWTVGGSMALGLGWRLGYLALPLVAAVFVVLAVARSGRQDAATLTAPALPGAGEHRPMLWRWVVLVFAVSAEFCCLLWAADAFTAWHHLSPALAATCLSAFLVGMAAGRVGLSSRTSGHPVRVVIWRQVALAGCGFALFWAAPWWPVSVAGLLVIGLGISVIYPVGVSHAIAAWPDRPDAAAARTLLASGLAIGGAPYLLARLADLADIRQAYLVVPVVLGLLALIAPLADPRDRAEA